MIAWGKHLFGKSQASCDVNTLLNLFAFPHKLVTVGLFDFNVYRNDVLTPSYRART